jgi:hypothetical protein
MKEAAISVWHPVAAEVGHSCYSRAHSFDTTTPFLIWKPILRSLVKAIKLPLNALGALGSSSTGGTPTALSSNNPSYTGTPLALSRVASVESELHSLRRQLSHRRLRIGRATCKKINYLLNSISQEALEMKSLLNGIIKNWHAEETEKSSSLSKDARNQQTISLLAGIIQKATDHLTKPLVFLTL